MPRPRCLGIASAIVIDEEVVFRAFGESGDPNKAIDADAIFDVGSITKVFTGVLLAEMAIQGDVELEGPLINYLPSGSKVPQQGERLITLVDLATHSSGLPRLPPNLTSSERFDPQDPYAHFNSDQLLKGLADSELSGEIGTTTRYSNFGFELLALALSNAAGATYADLLASRALKPLGLNQTSVWAHEQPHPRLVPGHGEFGDKAPFWSTPLPGDGGVVSTARDLAAFLQANFDEASPLAKSLEEARKLRTAGEGGNPHGLGWAVAKDKPGVQYHWHNGGSAGYGSFMALEIQKRRAVVVLSNTSHSSLLDRAGIRLLDALCNVEDNG